MFFLVVLMAAKSQKKQKPKEPKKQTSFFFKQSLGIPAGTTWHLWYLHWSICDLHVSTGKSSACWLIYTELVQTSQTENLADRLFLCVQENPTRPLKSHIGQICDHFPRDLLLTITIILKYWHVTADLSARRGHKCCIYWRLKAFLWGNGRTIEPLLLVANPDLCVPQSDGRDWTRCGSQVLLCCTQSLNVSHLQVKSSSRGCCWCGCFCFCLLPKPEVWCMVLISKGCVHLRRAATPGQHMKLWFIALSTQLAGTLKIKNHLKLFPFV